MDILGKGGKVLTDGESLFLAPSGGSKINDDITSTNTTWSSSKIEEEIVDIKIKQSPNLYIHGEPNINLGLASGFSATDYLQFPKVIEFGTRPFEIKFAFQTGDGDLTAQQNIIDSNFSLAFAITNNHFVLAISGDGNSWSIGVQEGTYTVLPNSPYFIKLTWDGNVYKIAVSTDGEDYTDDISITSNVTVYPRQVVIGVGNLYFSADTNWFAGTIDLNQCALYVDDELVWQGMSQDFASKDELESVKQDLRTKYEKPSTGIAENDLSAEVKAKLNSNNGVTWRVEDGILYADYEEGE